jgi:4-hydroxy-2-oxoglutarate aldolase
MTPSALQAAQTEHAAANGNHSSQASSARPLVGGVLVPTVAFFHPETEDVDVETTKRHATALAKAGVNGIVTQGSNGEAVCLSHAERNQITSATREALDSAGCEHVPVIVGCGAQSTREALELCQGAFQSGGDYALVLPPSYYHSIVGKAQILQFFTDLADSSPIGIVIYNYPGAVSGIDLSSDDIIALSQHPNIKGVKLTCGNTGKLARIVAGAANGFVTLGGSADFLLQTLIVGGQGTIAGTANLAPKSCQKICELFKAGKFDEARRIQEIVARGDWAAIKGGFPAVKKALVDFRQYGGVPRRPCVAPSGEQWKVTRAEFAELMQLEDKL